MAGTSPNTGHDVIGRVEQVDVLTLGVTGLHAKVDTGADLSSIWISEAVESDQGLACVFFAPGSEHYSGEVVRFAPGTYKMTRVSSSFGTKQIRYKVKLRIRLANRVINATFTLADRGNKLYPVLLGRRLLHSKFLVDVGSGKPLIDQEKARKVKLKQDLKKLKGGA